MEARPGHDVKKGILEMSSRAYNGDQRPPEMAMGSGVDVVRINAMSAAKPFDVLEHQSIGASPLLLMQATSTDQHALTILMDA